MSLNTAIWLESKTLEFRILNVVFLILFSLLWKQKILKQYKKSCENGTKVINYILIQTMLLSLSTVYQSQIVKINKLCQVIKEW